MTSIIEPQLLHSIRDILLQARGRVQQTVNHTMVESYWQVGRLIVEQEQQGKDRASYGTKQLTHLSEKLQFEFGKGFDVSNLRNMRKFYQSFPIQDAVRPELTWTHYRRLIRLDNQSARDWYLQESIEQNWSSRALDRQINKLYYERLLSSRKPLANNKSLIKEKPSENQTPLSIEQEAEKNTLQLKTNAKDFLRDPYIFDFLNLPVTSLLESTIEQALIDNLQKFLLELGKGFAFVARQQRITTEDQNFYIDLVFYHFKLKCFVLIDLKLGKLSHQDVGQMDTYVRIYDQIKKDKHDNPTIGLILCSEKSEAVAKYSVLTDSKQLFASKYLPFLPSEEELKCELERERALIVSSNEN